MFELIQSQCSRMKKLLAVKHLWDLLNNTEQHWTTLQHYNTTVLYNTSYIPIDIESELCFWDADKSVMLSAFTRERIRFGMICGQHKELIDWPCIGLDLWESLLDTTCYILHATCYILHSTFYMLHSTCLMLNVGYVCVKWSNQS